MFRRAFLAYPTLLRVGFADAVAYRVEFFIWILTTNMPLVMLALWGAVARDAPVGSFGQADFVAYFLASLLVRLLTGCWVGYELNNDIKQGTLAMRLLRPIHPLIAYSAENLAALPMRGLVAIPVMVGFLFAGRESLSHDPLHWLLFLPAMLGAWLLTFLVMALIGTLALFVESAISVFEAWLGVSSVLSGYLIPLDLFPHGIRVVALQLPFRFLLSFPVELMLGRPTHHQALVLLATQWAYVAAALLGLHFAWRAGMRRFGAYG